MGLEPKQRRKRSDAGPPKKSLHVQVDPALRTYLDEDAQRRQSRTLAEAAEQLMEDGLAYRRLLGAQLRLKLTEGGALELAPVLQ